MKKKVFQGRKVMLVGMAEKAARGGGTKNSMVKGKKKKRGEKR